jgi:hypothetical protein
MRSSLPKGFGMNSLGRFLVLISLLVAGDAWGETVIGTPIARVPITITKPGNYILSKDLVDTKDAAAIVVGTNDVTIDFNRHSLTITGTGADAGGVIVNSPHATVCNGTIIGGQYAIVEAGLVESITVEDMTCESQVGQFCIFVGTDCTVRRCNIINPSRSLSAYYGIEIASGIVEDCTISDLHGAAGQAPVGIFVEDPFDHTLNLSCIIRHCVISHLLEDGGSPTTGGVQFYDENTVVDDCSFYDLSAATVLGSGGTLIVKDSTFRACGSSFVGTNGGNNTIVP